jgi:hypothetical protein
MSINIGLIVAVALLPVATAALTDMHIVLLSGRSCPPVWRGWGAESA